MGYRSLGIDLSGWFSLASLAEGDPEGNLQSIAAWKSTAPNICVLPRFIGEKPRAGASAILTSWARGFRFTPKDHPWPNLGRLPAWIAWLAMEKENVNPQWHYENANGKGRVSLREVFQAYVAALLDRRSSDTNCGLKVVAIPDHFQERAQENLLNSLPGVRTDLRLLWRSVAACLSWSSTLTPKEMQRYHKATIAVVDVENASVSATILELRSVEHDGGLYLVPKRDLPEGGSSARWDILPLDLAICAYILDRLGEPYDLHELWQLCCGHVFHLDDNQGKLPHGKSVLIEFESGWRKVHVTPDDLDEATADAVSRSRVTGLSDLWQCAENGAGITRGGKGAEGLPLAKVLSNHVSQWLRNRPKQPDFLLLSGVLANVHTPSGKLFEEHLAELLSVGDDCEVFIPSRDLPDHFGVAHGCSLYGIREQAGLPTYLDTLPTFCILLKDKIHNKDEPISLINKTEWWGGREYRADAAALKRLRRLTAIMPGLPAVRFRLTRQDKRKELIQEFEHGVHEPCLLSFTDVRLRPAQGFARVDITPHPSPEDQTIFAGQELLLNWDTMHDEEEEQNLPPPDYPVCGPLEPDPDRYQLEYYVIPVIKEYIRCVRMRIWDGARTLLKRVADKIQSGKVYGSNPEGLEIDALQEAIEKHHRYYEQSGVFQAYLTNNRPAELRCLKDLVRASSALFSKSPDWVAQFLAGEFRRKKLESVFLNSSGRCFSEPQHVLLFIHRFEKHFISRMAQWKVNPVSFRPGMMNWCKAFQLILRLHDEAVEHMERRQADSLAECLQKLLEAVAPGVRLRLPRPYKQAMFSLYYLLRVRARKDGSDFLVDWDRKGSVSQRIHANLEHNKDIGINVDREETLQIRLIRYLKSCATYQDLIILSREQAAALGEKAEDDEDDEFQGGEA